MRGKCSYKLKNGENKNKNKNQKTKKQPKKTPTPSGGFNVLNVKKKTLRLGVGKDFLSVFILLVFRNDFLRYKNKKQKPTHLI